MEKLTQLVDEFEELIKSSEEHLKLFPDSVSGKVRLSQYKGWLDLLESGIESLELA